MIKKNVKNKISELKDINLEKKDEYITKRITRLSNKNVYVYLNNDNLIETMKYCISVYNKIVSFGIYKDKKLDTIMPIHLKKVVDIYKKELENKLKKIRFIYYGEKER